MAFSDFIHKFQNQSVNFIYTKYLTIATTC